MYLTHTHTNRIHFMFDLPTECTLVAPYVALNQLGDRLRCFLLLPGFSYFSSRGRILQSVPEYKLVTWPLAFASVTLRISGLSQVC